VTLGRDGTFGTDLRLGRSRRGTFDDLVQFVSIQPDAPAFRKVVNLDPLAIRHDKIDFDRNGIVHKEDISQITVR
jgi:hypothetical protein